MHGLSGNGDGIFEAFVKAANDGALELTLTGRIFDASEAPRPLKNVLPVVRTEASMQLDAIERMANCD